MADKKLQVRIDDRIRLMSAVLAVTDFPERAQQRKGHRPHAHARRTTKWLEPLRGHPAVVAAQGLLNKNAPIEAFYTYILKHTFPDLTAAEEPAWAPPEWNMHLHDFYHQSKLQDLWKQDQSIWEQSEVESREILDRVDFYGFLQPFVGAVEEQLVYMPNCSYPSDLAVGVRVGSELVCIGPPRIAWGDNEPWPFNEDPGHLYSSALGEYAQLLMLAFLHKHSAIVETLKEKSLHVSDEFQKAYPHWGDQFTALFVPGVVAIFLEHAINPQEAKSFIVMEKKLKGITILPGVISVLERYLNETKDGKFKDFIEFLPHFPGHLRIAKTISAI